MSALFPTSILLTLSDACCSMLRIQFLMSEQKEMDQLHKELKEIELNAIAQKKKKAPQLAQQSPTLNENIQKKFYSMTTTKGKTILFFFFFYDKYKR